MSILGPLRVLLIVKLCLAAAPYRRNGVSDPDRLWPNGIIPYVFDEEIDAYRKVHVLAGMKQIMLSTFSNHKQCIYFVPRTTEADYIHIQFSGKDSGTSQVGRAHGQQFITIHKDITQDSIVMALMVSIGVFPALARADRDSYLTINLSNVDPAEQKNFNIPPNTNTFNLPFDYQSSVMYLPYFSAVDKSVPTITTKAGGFTIGQTVSMSIGDVKLIQSMYHCAVDTTHRVDLLGPFAFECHFHQDFCQFTQDTTDNFDWAIQTGPSSTPGTGPKADHSSGSGSYALVQSINHHGQTAKLITPTMPAGTYCIAIWVYAFGADVGALSLTLREGGNEATIQAVTVQPVSQWYHTNGAFQSAGNAVVVIEATMGNGDQGDIAIDDVYIYKGRCIDWY
ncbi:meprin A subunit beta-like [Dreissena polymorpha]|uniref:Uncharacterized protein n=1 Tax=Dreissena polymorpha TaxID=45954 RepID=A0A9D4RRZ9_DREPO|nr:meprin A subunit beta-like [Dreissena polymorpha]KAH3876793.1 hypothetical protein DPMN_000643 [Dreissena polymorpha]